MLIGSATRYLASRGGVQTVYWRSKLQDCDAQGPKIVKYGRVLSFAGKKEVREPTASVATSMEASAGSTKRVLLKAYAEQMYAVRAVHSKAAPQSHS